MPNYETAHSYETVTLLRDGGAARIELNRPESMNAWNRQFGLDLLDAVRAVSSDETVRAVEIGGAGRGFSSGADLKAGFTPGPDGYPDVETVLHELYHPIILGIREMPKPVLAAVNGPAVGIGCSLAMCSDLIVAARGAYFLLAFVNIGLCPDGGSSVFVPARAGFTRAMEMSMLGERISADQALEWGLINRVFDDEQLMLEALRIAGELADGPTTALGFIRRLYWESPENSYEQQLDLECRMQRLAGATTDFQEGVNAFLEKRPAKFSGA